MIGLSNLSVDLRSHALHRCMGYTRHVQSQPGRRELPPRPVRYDRYVQSQSGPKVVHPGPVNNANLLYPSKGT